MNCDEAVSTNPMRSVGLCFRNSLQPGALPIMRICLYTNTAFPCMGGQEMVVDELARQYQKLGHPVVLLSPEPPHHLIVSDDDFPYRVERHPRFVSTRWFVSWYELALKRLYRKFKYDLIHCHNVYPNGYLAVKQKLQGGPPVVITSHGGDVRIDNPRFRKAGLLNRHRFAVQHADALISIGPFTEQGFLRLGAQQQLLHTISNGVHVQEYTKQIPRPDGLPRQINHKNYLLFVGRLVQLKGVDVLLKAAAIQQHDVQRSGELLQIVVCGDGQERAVLERLAHELGIHDRTWFLGNVKGDVKTWLYQNTATHVIPSRTREAFPMVLLEGFAAGCPIIASDAPGLADLVTHEETGWVVPRDNPQALADRITQVGNHPDLARYVCKAGQRIARKHDWQLVAEQHLQLFEQLAVQKQLTMRLAA